MIKNISFGGLYRGVRINYPAATGVLMKQIKHDYYPFKDEFKSEKEKDEFISNRRTQYFDNVLINDTVEIKEELPFTREEYENNRIECLKQFNNICSSDTITYSSEECK